MANRTHLLGLAIVLLLITAIAVYWSSTQSRFTPVSDGWEQGVTAWATGYDLPDDPNNPGEKVAWNITASADLPRSGARALKMQVDGTQDDGTIWLQRRVDVSGGETLELSFWSYSEFESFNTLDVLVAYIGEAPPAGEGSFEVLGPGDNWVGWHEFTYRKTIPGNVDSVYVAFGISVRWETDITQYFDDLEIDRK